MTTEQARRTMVLYSLATTVGFAVLLILSPIFIPSLGIGDAFRVLQIVFPVLAGYLGTAVIFLFRKSRPRVTVVDPQILRYLVYGSFAIFWAIALAVFVLFYVSNLATSSMSGMSIPELANYITLVVSFMNVTIGAMTAYLFDSEELQQTLGLIQQPTANNVRSDQRRKGSE